VTDHPALSTLSWLLAGHFASPGEGSLASFNAAGVASLVVGATQGDVLYYDGSVWTVLPPGVAGEVLTTQGPGANPIWGPGGGGGGDHAALVNLGWLVSAHTAVSPGSLAAFDALGATQEIPGVVQGDLLYFNGSTWVVFSPGLPGELLSTQGPGLPPLWVAPTGATLQSAYNAGNTITTAAVTPIAFTLASGGFTVDGPDLASFGSVVEVASFSAYASGGLTLQARTDSSVSMTANDAAARTLTIAASNVGAGSGDLAVNVDDRTTFTSQLGDTSPGWRFVQAGAGGDTADLYVGTTSPNGVVNGLAGSLFLRDTGAGGEAWLNTSVGSGTVWSQLGVGSTGITAAQHQTLLQLIHFIDEGPASGFTTGATKTVTGGAFPTEILWRRADTTPLVRQTLAYTDVYPTTVLWQIYAADGITVLGSVTDTITYSGPFETGRVRAIT
jgi:hypothetical protein